MRTSSALFILSIFVCAAAHAGPAATTTPDTGPAARQADFGALVGRWVRPDGGYTVTIKRVEAGGTLDAAYANPNPLPFAKAEASRDGKTIKVFLELRAGGYDGSTYTLTYDPARDVLEGVYYQAVARQRFDVQFSRLK